MQNNSNNNINKMKSNSIKFALDALESIQNNKALKELLSKDSILTYTEEMVGVETLNDREDTISDYMMMCNFTREEAEAAFNELDNY